MNEKKYAVIKEIVQGSQEDQFSMFESDDLQECKEWEESFKSKDVHGKNEKVNIFTVNIEDFESGNYNEL